DKVIIHHTAGNLTIRGCYDVWQSRPASAHYQVQTDGTIGQLVWDRDTAWHAGNFAANTTSIGIEHADVSSNPWAVSEACLDNGAHLVAAVCKFYGLGRPAWGKNVFGHKDFIPTACPASLAGSQHTAYMARAQSWYDQMTGNTPAPAPAPAPATPNIDTLADAVIRGEYGNGEERKLRLGANYAAVQQRVNEKLSGNASAPKPAGPNIDALADAVIRGDYGNGEERKLRLGANYAAVQARVNEKLAGRAPAAKPAGPNIDALADTVIRGEYGNGEDRKRRLGNLYSAVQARVNAKLGY
ncbi:MAG: N-acetylmuramoyl-L-alanine amidase, partial [Actinomycetaceae bacterium UMB1218B]|nr:N-acetylmuramoyl-L-alanine amidase [Actinomycetaceae bacterium UMB1218B]